MTINEHLTEFEGRTVTNFASDDAIFTPSNTAFRLAIDYDAHEEGKTFVDLFSTFLADPSSSEVEALIIGDWGGASQGDDSAPIVEALVSARDKLPKLKALFLGEMVMEESEISWIQQSDVSPLFEAWPNLEALYLRGGNGLGLGKPRHANLQKLVIESGGLSAMVIREVASAKLPSLRHLELWLGDDNYGNDIGVDALEELLSSEVCRNLTYLGLRDDCRADQTAEVLRQSGIAPTVKTLDLSLGTLGDQGAQALLQSPWLKQLAKLDIHHHYVSDELVARLKAVVKEVNAEDKSEEDVWDGEGHRYVAVGE